MPRVGLSWLRESKLGKVRQAISEEETKLEQKTEPSPPPKKLIKKTRGSLATSLTRENTRKGDLNCVVFLLFHNYLPFELGKRLNPDHPRMFLPSLAENGTVVPEGADFF